MRSTLFALSVVALAVPLAVACGPRSNRSGQNDNPQPTATVPAEPLTVIIDANQTMTAVGGDGVGVFVEYKSGGHWHVWWTCDTNHSKLACSFTISGSVLGGVRNLTGDSSASLSAGSLVASSTVTTDVKEIFFDANPGEKLTLDARVNGIDPTTSLFFFVQDGKINGAYPGALTNPLIFKPSQV